MDFKFLIPSKNVDLLNPSGTIAICTLWTPPDYIRKLLISSDIISAPEKTPIAAIGGLYGGGLKILLRNILFNPQIDTIVLFGKDYSGSGEHLKNFFLGKVEKTGKKQKYIFDDGMEQEIEKVSIIGAESRYTMDALLMPDEFDTKPRIIDSIHFDRNDGLERLAEFLSNYTPLYDGCFGENDRKAIPLPTPVVSSFPSDKGAHSITADTILEGWEKLLYRLSRFGVPVQLRNGKNRNELANMKVVIRYPMFVEQNQLTHFNIPEDEIVKYKEQFLDPEIRDHEKYTYGNRLRAYFKKDCLASVVKDLAQQGDSRHSFITLWDNVHDVEGGSVPCLVSLFFRKVDNKVSLTAVFRSHNATRAWPRNSFGLAGIMAHVCEKVNSEPDKKEHGTIESGELTVVSLSIAIDPSDLDQVKEYIDDYANRIPKISLDPYGYLRISTDNSSKSIIIQQFDHEDEFLAEYRGKTPSDLSKELCQKEVISDISHALYIGGQLEKAYFCLKNDKTYIQDKTIIRC